MIYLLLIIIILLIYIAFLTPEKMERRGIRKVQKIFGARISSPKPFFLDDPRNETHPDEMVKYKNSTSSRKLAGLLHNAEYRSLEMGAEKNGHNFIQTDEIVADGSDESGRRYIFRAIKCYMFLKLDKNANEKDIERAYSDAKNVTTQNSLPDVEFAYEFILDSLEILEDLSLEAKNDFENFFDYYKLFIDSKSKEDKVHFEKYNEEDQLYLFDSDVASHSLKYK